MKGLSLHKLNAGYQKKNVICDLSLPELQRGKITIILGPNGCGKSTLLRALAGLNKANGKVFLDGVNLMQMPFSARADSTIFLPQFLPHDVHLNVLESILVSLRASKMGGKHEKNTINSYSQTTGDRTSGLLLSGSTIRRTKTTRRFGTIIGP